jgi:Domain of unknown function (DUF4386)
MVNRFSMRAPIREVSPGLKARIAGGLYLVIIITGVFADLVVHERLVVDRDAAATAANILAHESLYRSGGVAILIMLVCDTAVSLILYQLLKPVSKTLSALAALFRLIDVAIIAVGSLEHFAALILLKGTQSLPGFRADQLQDLAFASLNFYSQNFNVGMVFFAFACLLLGYLICRSTFLPWMTGMLMAVAGLCYLANSFAFFVYPPLAQLIYPYVLVPCFVGELVLSLWLLVIGVNSRRWEEQAKGAASAAWSQEGLANRSS